MSVDVVLIITVGVLVACGVTLILERSLTRILLGFVLLSNGINVLFLVSSGRPGPAPIIEELGAPTADPLPQAMALTAIVITMGVTAFGLALAYRTWQIDGNDDVQDDFEDALVMRRAERDLASDSFDEVDTDLPDEEGADESPADQTTPTAPEKDERS